LAPITPPLPKDGAVMAGPGRRHELAGRDFMTLVPARVVDWEDDPATGLVVALLPRFRDPILGRLLQPRLPQKRRWVRVTIDERGSLLWRAVDGARPVSALVPLYLEAFPHDLDEAHERVCRWVYAAYAGGLMRFVNLGDGEPAAATR
jgi:hypothetical protein